MRIDLPRRVADVPPGGRPGGLPDGVPAHLPDHFIVIVGLGVLGLPLTIRNYRSVYR